MCDCTVAHSGPSHPSAWVVHDGNAAWHFLLFFRGGMSLHLPKHKLVFRMLLPDPKNTSFVFFAPSLIESYFLFVLWRGRSENKTNPFAGVAQRVGSLCRDTVQKAWSAANALRRSCVSLSATSPLRRSCVSDRSGCNAVQICLDLGEPLACTGKPDIVLRLSRKMVS